jgi:hypothetical protein
MLAIGRAVEGQTHVLQFQHDIDRVLAHDIGRVLVHQVVAALDRVEGVPLPVVFLQIAQRRADAALGRAGMRAGGIELADDSHVGILGGVQRGHQASAAGADDDCVELVVVHGCAPF